MQLRTRIPDRERRLDEVLAGYFKPSSWGSRFPVTTPGGQPIWRPNLELFFANQACFQRCRAVGAACWAPRPFPSGPVIGNCEFAGPAGPRGHGRRVQGPPKRRTCSGTSHSKCCGRPAGDTRRTAAFPGRGRRHCPPGHPHLVPILEVGEHEGQLINTCRAWPCGSLADRPLITAGSRGQGPGPSRNGYPAGHRGQTPCTTPISAASARDLKPSNICSTRKAGPRSDFGLARRLIAGDEAAPPSTTSRRWWDSNYMAPEQASGSARGRHHCGRRVGPGATSMNY